MLSHNLRKFCLGIFLLEALNEWFRIVEVDGLEVSDKWVYVKMCSNGFNIMTAWERSNPSAFLELEATVVT